MRKLLLHISLFGILIGSFAGIANAGWFDFVGDVAKAGASTAINITWAETVKFLAPTIVLIIITILPVAALFFASTLVWKFIDLIEDTIKDKITWKEAISIILSMCLVLPIVLALCFFSYKLMGHSLTGLESLGK